MQVLRSYPKFCYIKPSGRIKPDGLILTLVHSIKNESLEIF
jgi:hypothetical protein